MKKTITKKKTRLDSDDDSDLESLPSFIDNEETENDINFYRNFDNVETDIEQTLKSEYD